MVVVVVVARRRRRRTTASRGGEGEEGEEGEEEGERVLAAGACGDRRSGGAWPTATRAATLIEGLLVKYTTVTHTRLMRTAASGLVDS